MANFPVWVFESGTLLSSGLTDAQGNFTDSIPSVQTNTVLSIYSHDCFGMQVSKNVSLAPAAISVVDSLMLNCQPMGGYCQVGFSYTASSLNPFSINFTDTTYTPPGSTLSTSSWTFGDGNISTQTSPTHTYSAPGKYYVCLTVTQNDSTLGPICTKTICDTVEVDPPAATCSANFSWVTDSQRGIAFNNNSTASGTGGTTNILYRWDFGDGAVANTDSAYHVYSQGGRYLVCLTQYVVGSIQGDTICSDTHCDSVSTADPGPGLNCNAHYIIDTANSFFAVAYIWNMSSSWLDSGITGDATHQYLWTFGDGNTSTDPFPTHIYQTRGFYEVCVTLIANDTVRGDTCQRTFCDSVGVDAQGNLLWKNGSAGFTLNVLNPATIGVHERFKRETMFVFPNPASDRVVIQFRDEINDELKWSIYGLTGKIMSEGNLEVAGSGGEIQLDIPNGFYILQVESKDAFYRQKLQIKN